MSTTSLRQDARVIGLVGVSHGVSHFYHLILAGLFPWLKSASPPICSRVIFIA